MAPASAKRAPEREKLAAAIAVEKRARAAVAANERAIGRADELVMACSERLQKAKAAIARAKDADATRMAKAAAKSGAAPAASAMGKARAAEQVAADELAAARSAHQRFETAERDLKNTLAIAEVAVETARDRVLAAEFDVAGLVEEAQTHARELARCQHLLRYLAGGHLIEDPDLKERVQRVLHMSMETHAEPTAAAFAALCKRLAADADVPVALRVQ